MKISHAAAQRRKDKLRRAAALPREKSSLDLSKVNER